MAGELKVKNKHNQLVILDADKLEDFKKAIGHITISEYFRQHQIDVVEEYQKNAEGLSNPIGLPAMAGTNYNKYINKDKNLSLDCFLKTPKVEFQQMLEEVDDYNTNSKLNKMFTFGIQVTKINFRRLK